MKKRLLSTLLALSMLVGMVPTLGITAAAAADSWEMAISGGRTEGTDPDDYEAAMVYSAQPTLVGNELGYSVMGPINTTDFWLRTLYEVSSSVGEGTASETLDGMKLYVSNNYPFADTVSGDYLIPQSDWTSPIGTKWWSDLTSNAGTKGIGLQLSAAIGNTTATVGGVTISGGYTTASVSDISYNPSDFRVFTFWSPTNYHPYVGEGQYIASVNIMLKDGTAPAVKSLSVEDNYITLSFYEPLRQLWASDTDVANYTVALTGTDEYGTAVSVSASVVGFSEDCKEMVLFPNMSGTYASNYDILNITTIDFGAQYKAANLYDNNYYDTGEIYQMYRSCTAYSDYAGNSMENYSCNFTLYGASPLATEFDMSGSMITETTTDLDPTSWPDDVDRSSVFAGVGDTLDFTMTVHRQNGSTGSTLYAHDTSKDDEQGYLVLNVADEDGTPVTLSTTTVVNRSQQANADATGLINFETFVVEEGMYITDSVSYVHPISYVGSNDLYDVNGLPVKTQDVSSVNVAKKIYLDAAAPTVTSAVTTTNEGYLSVTTTIQDVASSGGITAEMMDTEARFALYGDSYIGQTAVPIQYEYSTDGGSTWTTATMDATAAESDQFPLSMISTTNTQTLLFNFPDTTNLTLTNLNLAVTTTDIAGTSGTTTVDLSSYTIDNCAPILSVKSSGVSYGTDNGTFTGVYEIIDYVSTGLSATYQWDDGSEQSAQVSGNTFTIERSEEAGTTTSYTLTINIKDDAGNAGTIYTETVSFDMTLAQSVYQLGDLSAPSTAPDITVSSPTAKDDTTASTTRVTVTAGGDTYVRIFSSDDQESNADLFDFDATWYKVTIEDGKYTDVSTVNFSDYYGTVSVAIASAYADLTPTVNGSVDLTAVDGYNDRGNIATAKYAPKTEGTYSVSNESMKYAAGYTVGFSETKTFDLTLQDYVVTFNVANTQESSWGVEDMDFENSLFTLYFGDEAIWTSKLTNSTSQQITLPTRTYETGLYTMEVTIASKGGDSTTVQLFTGDDEEIVVDNVIPSDGGLWEYSIPTSSPNYNVSSSSSSSSEVWTENVVTTSHDADKPLDYIGAFTSDETFEYVGADGTTTTATTNASSIPSDILWSQQVMSSTVYFSGSGGLNFSVENPADTVEGKTVGNGLTLHIFNQDKSYEYTTSSTNLVSGNVNWYYVSTYTLAKGLGLYDAGTSSTQTLYYQFELNNGNKTQVQQFTFAYFKETDPFVSADLTFDNEVWQEVNGEEKLVSVDVGIENIKSITSNITVYHASFDDATWSYNITPYSGPVTCYYEDFTYGNFVSVGYGDLSTKIDYSGTYGVTAEELFILVDEWGGVAYYVPHLEKGYSPYNAYYTYSHDSGYSGPYGNYQFISAVDELWPYDIYLDEGDIFPTAVDGNAVTVLAFEDYGSYNINVDESTITWNDSTADWVQSYVTPNDTGIVGGGHTTTYVYEYTGSNYLYYDDQLADEDIPEGYEYDYYNDDWQEYVYKYMGETYYYSDVLLTGDEIPTSYEYWGTESYYYLKLANPIGTDGADFAYDFTINATGYTGDTKAYTNDVSVAYQSAIVDTTQGNALDNTNSTVYFNTYLQAVSGVMDYKYTLPTDMNVELFPDITFTDAYGGTQVVSGLSLAATDKPTVTVSSMEENTPVTLTFAYTEAMYLSGLTYEMEVTDDEGNVTGSTTVSAIDAENIDIEGDGTTELTVTLRANVTLWLSDESGDVIGYFNVQTIDSDELEAQKGETITDATVEYFNENGETVDTAITAAIYGTVTAKIYTQNNGEKEYMVDSKGVEIAYVFDPSDSGYVTSYTYVAGTYFDKYGATSTADVTLALGEITLKVSDSTAPSMQFTAAVSATGSIQYPEAVYSVVATNPEDDHPELPTSSYTVYDSTADFVAALGWGTTYTLTCTVADKLSTDTYIKSGEVTTLNDFDYISDEISGVVHNEGMNSITVTGTTTFTVITVDENDNASFATFTFAMESTPVPTANVSEAVDGVVTVTLTAPTGVTNLSITNSTAQTDAQGNYYITYSKNEDNAVVSYSMSYNGFTCTGAVLVNITGIAAAFTLEDTAYSASYYASMTNKDVTVTMPFSQPIQTISGSNLNAYVDAYALDSTVYFTISGNTSAISGITITDIYNQSVDVSLPAVNNIDKTAPTIAHTSTLLSTGVYQYTFQANETVSFTENGEGGKTTFTRNITANGDYTFNFVDLAGNTTVVTVTEDNYPETELALTFSTTESGSYKSDLDSVEVGSTFYVKANQACTLTFNGATYEMTADVAQALTMYGTDLVTPCVVAVNEYKDYVCHVFNDITFADTTAPQIVILDSDYSISLPVGDDTLKADLLENIIVVDNRDATDAITVTVDYGTATGNNVVTYTAKDTSGNTSTATFTMRVFGENSAVVYVDGAVVSRDAILIMDSGSHDITVTMPVSYSSIEPYSLSIEAGRKTAAQMKIGATMLLDQTTSNQTMTIQLDDIGYYTVLVQSQSRDNYIFTLYIQ